MELKRDAINFTKLARFANINCGRNQRNVTAANASMGAISLFPQLAGSASAVYGFTHALLASGVGVVAGRLYAGRLLEPALIMLGCAVLALSGLLLTPRPTRPAQPATVKGSR